MTFDFFISLVEFLFIEKNKKNVFFVYRLSFVVPTMMHSQIAMMMMIGSLIPLSIGSWLGVEVLLLLLRFWSLNLFLLGRDETGEMY